MEFTIAQCVVGLIIICMLINSIELLLIGFVYAIVFGSIIWIVAFTYAVISINIFDITIPESLVDPLIFIITLGGII